MRIQGSWIVDSEGRALILRGCNLGGSTKVPVGYEGEGALEVSPSAHCEIPPASGPDNPPGADSGPPVPSPRISYTGKPFPLEDAGARFAELARWGLRWNRLIVPWEAIEHEGPGIYDEAYLAYLRKLLLAAEEHGVRLWIDPHQDVWGRAAGGDGAPAWTLEALGIDTGRLEAAGAILPRTVTGITPPECRPLMTWPAGNNRYAAATMFTLFFAGSVYAPDTRVGNENIQDWLQTRFIEAFAHARRRLKNCAAIAGWGTMNEPHPGFTGYTNLAGLENNMVAVGPMPSPFAAMGAASGYTMEIPVYMTGISGVRQTGKAIINSEKVSVFQEGFSCPWKAAGIWDDSGGVPRLCKPDHFARYQGRPARFAEDFLKPFIERFVKRLGEADEKTLFFVEGVPAGIGTGDDISGGFAPEGAAAGRFVNAFHWYDGPTMFIKQFRPWFNYDTAAKKIVLGKKAVAKLYRKQIAAHICAGMPNLLGEFGLPFDLFKGRAFRTGDYRVHEEALDMYYNALDDLLLGACIWDYSADNTFHWGDLWNNEDFSIVTSGDGSLPLAPRAEGGWLRPYPLATAGTPLRFEWNRKKKSLCFRYRCDPALAAPTLLFIPAGKQPEVSVAALSGNGDTSRMSWEYLPEEQNLAVRHNGFDGEVEVRAVL